MVLWGIEGRVVGVVHCHSLLTLALNFLALLDEKCQALVTVLTAFTLVLCVYFSGQVDVTNLSILLYVFATLL